MIYINKLIANSITITTGPKLDEPLCFTAVDPSATITFKKMGNPDAANIVTSTNGQNWTPYTFGTTITLANVGDKVYFRAANENDISFFKSWNDLYQFATTDGKRIAASGNIQTLMKADGSRLDISGKNYCYAFMFSQCASLTTTPTLPATTLASDCYNYMFYSCTSLTTAPALPATTLAERCYYGMFNGCSNLASIDVNFTTWNTSEDATTNWVSNVAASGTFTCPGALPKTTGPHNIPSGWTINEK